MKNSDVVVRLYDHELDAEIAKGHLSDAGIESMIAKDDGGGMLPSLQQGDGVQLIVPLSQLEQAKRIIDHDQRSV
jgi:hypothetical protein